MKNFVTKIALFLAVMMLALSFAACGGDTAETTAAETTAEAAYTFTLNVVFKDKSTESHTVSTNCETVGEALIEAGLIEGEESQYGLYVKSVCGEVADYEVDQTYWALYVGGEYSMIGVDALRCADVTAVEFRAEK